MSIKNNLNLRTVKLSFIFFAIIVISFLLFSEYKKNDIAILKNSNHEKGGAGIARASSQDVKASQRSQNAGESAIVRSDFAGTTMIAGNNDLPGFAVLVNSTSGAPKVAGVAELIPIPKAGINFWELVLPGATAAVLLQFLFYRLFWRKNNSP